MKILTSNGSNKFYLASLSVELARKGMLAGMLTSGWPTKEASWVARPFKRNAAIQRFFNRHEPIPAELVYATNVAEVMFQIGIRLRRFSEHTEQYFNLLPFWWYTTFAQQVIKRLRPDIYHYRSCYGSGSVISAKNLGIATICDHSIAHPGVLKYMVDNEGRWPSRTEESFDAPLLRLMKRDIDQADHVLVNSDFVKDTFIFAGVPRERINVVYTGVTDQYLKSAPNFDAAQVQRRATQPMLFAGGVQRRKGIPTLAKSFLSLGIGVRLRLIGDREAGIERAPLMNDFFSHSMVESLAGMPWGELADFMVKSPIFIFPSYCEGSARVIFEAMACGCFVITTPNSGSIVENNVHGLVVPAGDAMALAMAIRHASANPQWVAQVGWQNAELIRKSYRQVHYIERAVGVYRRVLQDRR